MSQWISIEEAADKYQIDEEYLWLWAEMKEFDVNYTQEGTYVDENCIQQFIKRGKDRVTLEYVNALEQLCIEKSKSCRLYISLLGMRDKQIALTETVHHISWAKKLWWNLREFIRL